jgi:flagellar biosynthesis GTPase FlhF
MGRHSRHYTDLNPLEGGGSGGGRGYASPIGGAVGAAGVLGTTKVMLDKAEKDRAARDTAESAKERAAANEIKRESRSKEEPMTAGQKQSMQDAKDEEAYQKRKTAPTTKTEMGKAFAKGGMTASSRADGCATKGKTKGRFV